MAKLDKNDLAQMNEDYFKSLEKERLVEVAKNLHQLATDLWEKQQQSSENSSQPPSKDNPYGFLFEMENSSAYNIKLIDNWDYNNPAFIEVKYEDLILDVDLFLFHKIFTFLGFSGEVIPELLRIAYDNSIFSGNLRKSVHIRSAQQNQWKKYFKPQHKAKFLELYGDILIKLGYEKNNDWADHRGESEDSPR